MSLYKKIQIQILSDLSSRLVLNIRLHHGSIYIFSIFIVNNNFLEIRVRYLVEIVFIDRPVERKTERQSIDIISPSSNSWIVIILVIGLL